MGRPSIAPEMLLRAMLLQAFYSVRSERQLMERLEYDLLFRWFVGFGAGLSTILAQPRVRRLLSSDHFSVDGTLVEAWASTKSFRPRDELDRPGGDDDGGRNPAVDFRAEKRSNATHGSTTDPDAMLYRKGSGIEARRCYIGHGLMENRSACWSMPGSRACRAMPSALPRWR